MKKRLSAAAIPALKEALTCIYWYRTDLRTFLSAILPSEILSRVNWELYKRNIVSDAIDSLLNNQDKYLPHLTKLCEEVANFSDFSHLQSVDDGAQKIDKAKKSVAALKKLVAPHEDVVQEEAEIQQRVKRHQELMNKNSAIQSSLSLIKQRYLTLISSNDPQKRGLDLEKLMHDLFSLFDLDPKASFKITGEQIDGAFSLQGTEYLFEAKWTVPPIGLSELDSFKAKVERKLDNTLGLFLSINGFSQESIEKLTGVRQSILLMDGADLMAVFEERLDFVVLVLRKKQHASRTGEIFLPISKILC